jgi:hypothetical protein
MKTSNASPNGSDSNAASASLPSMGRVKVSMADIAVK